MTPTRFAFYGRVSTEDQQDPTASRAWQLARAGQLVEPHGGEVVVEFFDIGQSRSLPWKRRPEAARLLEAVADPGRCFDAIVVGGLARAFGDATDQALVLRVLGHHGVGLWHPDAQGAHDPANIAHRLTASIRAELAQEERETVRRRVRDAMTEQARAGRWLGGRPPYGYRLVDTDEPHPNPAKAAAGAMLRRLEPHPDFAPVVARIFGEYIDGAGLRAIAEGLDRDGVPSPSAADPARNPHRSQAGWAKTAVKAIIENPRYTGRQVWARAPRVDALVDVADAALGYRSHQVWADEGSWVYSTSPSHEPLVDDATFAGAQRQRGTGSHRPATRKPRATPRTYVLAGRVHCSLCGTRMGSQVNHGRAHYRCRGEATRRRGGDHPKSAYLREDTVTDALDRWVARLFDPDHLEDTVEALVAADAAGLDDASVARGAASRATLEDVEAKMARFRTLAATLADPTPVAGWIAEEQARAVVAEKELAALAGHAPRGRDEIRSLVLSVGSVATRLGQAPPELKKRLYSELGVSVTYEPGADLVRITAEPRVGVVRVGGPTRPLPTRDLRRSATLGL